MSYDIREERYIVFYPRNPTISERTLKQIVFDNMCCAQLWDEEFPIPWVRYPIPVQECEFHPLAISVREAFCPDIEEELVFMKDTANIFGYDVYEKTYKFIPQKVEEEKQPENPEKVGEEKKTTEEQEKKENLPPQ